jgi:hypothetical protein
MGKVQNEKLHKLNSATYYWRDKMQENMTDGICSTNNEGDKCMRNFTCLIRYLVYNAKEIYICMCIYTVYIYIYIYMCVCVYYWTRRSKKKVVYVY